MRSQEKEIQIIYMVFNLIILNFAIAITALLSPTFILWDYNILNLYAIYGNAAWLLTYYELSKNNLFLREGFMSRIFRITQRTSIFFVTSVIFAFLFMPKGYSRHFLVEYTVVFYVLEIVYYGLLYNYLRRRNEKGTHVNNALIVGLNDTARLLRLMMDSNPLLGYRFTGYVSDEPADENGVVGTDEDLLQLISDHKVQILFVTVSLFNNAKNNNTEILRLCNKNGVRLRFVPENQQYFKHHTNQEIIGNLLVINPQEMPLDSLQARYEKRFFDIVFSVLVIVFVLSWLLPILAILIKLSSKGPVFFIQERTGFNNKPFRCFKFRSMQLNPDANLKQATKNDARITFIGRFLRKSNMDELPQFFNVLVGQMSVVGPRPHMLKHTDQYAELIEDYLIRHYVKPGITGWAQANGYRGETSELWMMKKRVEYDMVYLENWTFWKDIQIILMTMVEVKPLKGLFKRIFFKKTT